MKKRIIVLLMAALVSFGSGCGSQGESEAENRITESGIENKMGNRSSENDTVYESEKGTIEAESSEAENQYSYQDTIFRYGGKEYDLSERDNMINDISECIPVGKYIIVDGHTDPYNGIYSFFNTETEEFEKEIAGALLTFHDDDINTVVYAFWQDIYAYDGKLLATCNLEEGEGIRNISYNEDCTKLEIEILTAEGNSRREEVELL